MQECEMCGQIIDEIDALFCPDICPDCLEGI